MPRISGAQRCVPACYFQRPQVSSQRVRVRSVPERDARTQLLRSIAQRETRRPAERPACATARRNARRLCKSCADETDAERIAARAPPAVVYDARTARRPALVHATRNVARAPTVNRRTRRRPGHGAPRAALFQKSSDFDSTHGASLCNCAG